MKEKCKLALKVILVLIAAVCVLVYAVTRYKDYREQKLKESIHAKLWDMCQEENMRLTDEPVEYRDRNADYNNEAYLVLSEFEYGDELYECYFSVISENLVDTSQVLAEVQSYYDETIVAQLYRIKEAPEDYMLAAKIGDVYYLYSTYACPHDSLEEYIDIRGGKEKLSVEYVEIIVMENEEKAAQYIYGEDASEWVWNVLLGCSHEYIGRVLCPLFSGDKYTLYPEKSVRLNVCIRDKGSGAIYNIVLMNNGNIGFAEGIGWEEMDFEYLYSPYELLEAFEALVKNYEAYKVE